MSPEDPEVHDYKVIHSHKDAGLPLQRLRAPRHYVSTRFSDNQSVTSQVKMGCIQTHIRQHRTPLSKVWLPLTRFNLHESQISHNECICRAKKIIDKVGKTVIYTCN